MLSKVKRNRCRQRDFTSTSVGRKREEKEGTGRRNKASGDECNVVVLLKQLNEQRVIDVVVMADVKYYLLKLLVVLIYFVSHVYDYLTYPIFMIIYHPWRVRRYKKSNHARREDRDDAIIYHSLQEPTEKNTEIERNQLDTMDKVFRYVSPNKLRNKLNA